MSLFNVSLVTFALATGLLPGTGLRLYNPNDRAVTANVACADWRQPVEIAAGTFTDVGAAELMPCVGTPFSLDSADPLVAIETRIEAVDTQRLISNDACGAVEMSVPLFACKSGRATATVPFIEGASYQWSVDGATILEGLATQRIAIALGSSELVRLSCTIAAPTCTRTAAGVIVVREPLVVKQFNVPQNAEVGTPITLTWSYDGALQPASQLLSGDALLEPVSLPAAQRSYQFTPKISGSRTIQLDASHATAIHLPTPGGGKRRSVGKSAVTATCPSVAATAKLEVKGCAIRPPHIDVPATIAKDASFTASIPLEVGDVARWTVINGTSNSDTGSSITIVANGEGDVEISVRVERGAECFVQSAVTVALEDNRPCVNPTATVELLNVGCTLATIGVTLTGTPPFTGNWSDGFPLSTYSNKLERQVSTLGTYRLVSFSDARCNGTISGEAVVSAIGHSVTLESVGGSCTNNKLVARFRGVPPFEGKWCAYPCGNEWFKTSEYELELDPSDAGTYYVEALRDSQCENWKASNSVIVDWAPSAGAQTWPSCQVTPGAPTYIYTFFGYGRPPYRVEWTDGVVSEASEGSYVARQVPIPTTPHAYYEIANATASGCNAELTNRIASVSFRPPPFLESPTHFLCDGSTATATLSNGSSAFKPPLHPEAQLVWTVEKGEVVSGQGTPSITYRGTEHGWGLVKVTAVYPDGECSSYGQDTILFAGEATITDFRVEPSTIKAGGSALVKYTIGGPGMVSSFSVSPPAERMNDISIFPECANGACTQIYKDTKGAGIVELELQYFNDCLNQLKTAKTTLTIE